MMIHQLTPASVWHAFEVITRIPRGHGNKRRLADFIYGEALSLGLAAHKDNKNNVLVWIEGSQGRESESAVTIQSHMDLASLKTEESEHEFEEEGISLIVEGDRVKADSTSLGADKVIGPAMMMALMHDRSISHPPLELIFSAVGSKALSDVVTMDAGKLKGKRLISLDYEEEGALVNGTSGVMITQMILEGNRHRAKEEHCLKITVQGLPGGHSGLDIHKEMDNAILLLGRLLLSIRNRVGLISFQSEQPFNTIPKEAQAIVLPMEKGVEVSLRERFEMIRKENSHLADASLTVEGVDMVAGCYDERLFSALLSAIHLTPAGVIVRNPLSEMPILSSNLYKIKETSDQVIIGNMTRYAQQTLADSFLGKMDLLCDLIKGEIKIVSNIPVWAPVAVSKNRQISNRALRHVQGEDSKGAQAERAPEGTILAPGDESVDTIALVPDIFNVRTVNESVSISSIQRTYGLLVSILAATH